MATSYNVPGFITNRPKANWQMTPQERRQAREQNQLAQLLLRQKQEQGELANRAQELENVQTQAEMARQQQRQGKPTYKTVGNMQVPVDPVTGQVTGPAVPIEGLPDPNAIKPNVELASYLPGSLREEYLSGRLNPQSMMNLEALATGLQKSGERGGAPKKYTNVKDGAGYNPDTGQIENVPVSPEIQAQRTQAKAQFADNQQRQAQGVMQEIGKAISFIDKDQGELFSSSGGTWGAMADWLPALDGYALSRTIDTVQANLSFDKLQAIRDASKTGGGLGAVSERELQLLGSAVASLDPGLPAEEKRRNLEKVFNHYNNFLVSLGKQRENIETYTTGNPAARGNVERDDGWGIVE